MSIMTELNVDAGAFLTDVKMLSEFNERWQNRHAGHFDDTDPDCGCYRCSVWRDVDNAITEVRRDAAAHGYLLLKSD